jgi:ABC-type multidrug transport system permease subunit
MIVVLGIAFRNQPVERIYVDVIEAPTAASIAAELQSQGTFVPSVRPEEEARRRLRFGSTALVVDPRGETGGYEYVFDPTRPDSLIARKAVDDALQRAAGRVDPKIVSELKISEPGGRYVDFLVPGLLGMGIMGGGLWGVGFVTVNMRTRKLLKRLLATPMPRSYFLAGIMISRLLFIIPEVLTLLIFARLSFGVVIQGSLFAVLLFIVTGSVAFAGIGLLVASRARTVEAVSGLMNLVMLPMWMLSGIFFSSQRYPEAFQPFIKALPLTPLIDALRAIMQEGAPLSSQLFRLAILAAWAAVSFTLALRWFRWT